MSKHTPRKQWTFIPARDHTDSITGLKHRLPGVVVEDGIGCIATVNFGGPHHDNAEIGTLIASAPDLLAALQAYAELEEEHHGDMLVAFRTVTGMIHAAIARATQEQAS